MSDPLILVNGKSVDTISVMDRGLAFGDGLFETIAVINGKLPLRDYHLSRLNDGCLRLKIPMPDTQTLLDEIKHVVRNDTRKTVKVILTRGEALRGYVVPAQQTPSRIVMASDWPELPVNYWTSGVRIRICETRMAQQPALAGIKHLNRLEQVMARNEWDDTSIQEGIMLDRTENIIETTSHNVFMVKDGGLLTPDLSACGVAGIMRSYIIEKAKELGIQVQIKTLPSRYIDSADELFLCNSIHGIWPVCDIDGRKFKVGKLTSQLREIVAKILPYNK